MSHIIAIANQKGGVAKTTTAVNLAAGLAIQGQKTLLVDLDPQGNASQSVRLPQVEGPLPGIYEVLANKATISDVTVTVNKRLDFVGSDVRLSNLDAALQDDTAIYRLKDALAPVNHKFVVLDCPPSLGEFTKNALAAASHVLVPAEAEFYNLDAIAQTLETVRLVKERINPDLQVLGILLTSFELKTRLAREVLKVLQDQYRGLILPTPISKTVRIREAASHQKSIFEYDYPASNDYERLVHEVIKRVGKA